MKTAHLIAIWVTAPVLATVLIGWGALTVSAQSRQPGELSRIVFAVKWYDVGKAALEGLPGIHRVSSGWQGSREINSVIYDTGLISVEQMISALKASGTYIGIAEPD